MLKAVLINQLRYPYFFPDIEEFIATEDFIRGSFAVPFWSDIFELPNTVGILERPLIWIICIIWLLQNTFKRIWMRSWTVKYWNYGTMSNIVWRWRAMFYLCKSK